MDHRKIYFMILLFLVSVLQLQVYSEDTRNFKLEVVQALFRHGDRTPRKAELYPKLSYNSSVIDSIGLGQLTKVGCNRAYRLGTLLRKEYDNFLGDYPYPGNVVATSTDLDRTKMTLQLVLAGLYPSPSTSANCTPVPMSYVPLIVDNLLMPERCSMYMQEFKEVINSPEIHSQVAKYRDLFEFVGENTGYDMSKTPITAVFNTHQLLESQRSMNIHAPEWVTPSVQKKMEDVVAFAYELRSYSTKLKRLSGGPMIKQFIENMNLDGKRETSAKIYLYSAHDLNIASFAKASGFREPKIPSYGSMIILEKLRDTFGAVFVRIRLWTGITEEWITYPIYKCGTICPINKYVNLMRNVIPTDEEVNCLWNSVTKDQLHKYYKEKTKIEPFPTPPINIF